jgi:hypothetical protein
VTPISTLPPVRAYRPATFKERGVAVPFTSPLLIGARVRRGQRHRVELVVPNPSGGRGVYILPWASARALLRPTVHDSRLNQRIGMLKDLTPATVRQAGLEIASLGLAGRRAKETALAAIASDAEDRRVTACMLLIAIASQADPYGLGATNWHDEPTPELERRAQMIIERTAHKFDQSPQAILAAVGALAAVLAPGGLAVQTRRARLPRLMQHLTDLRTELVEWAQEHAVDTRADLADMITGFVDFAVAVAEVSLTRLHAMLGNVASLLTTWSRCPQHVMEYAARPEWLLDGWEQVCQVWWSSPSAEHRRAALTEMAQLIPVVPHEVSDWVAASGELDDGLLGAAISLNADWRTAVAMLNLTARNERIRAHAL